MDAEEIARLCEQLHLDEGDGPVVRMNREQYHDGKETMECCLLGKVMGTKAVNREAMEEVMNRI